MGRSFRYAAGRPAFPMGLKLGISSNARGVACSFSRLLELELRKAEAVAVTKAAFDARDELRQSMGRAFRLRSRGLPKAVVSTAGEKRDWPRIHADVGIRDDARFPAGFLVWHVLGGTKRPERAKSILVPTKAVKRTGTGRIPKRFRPRDLIDAGKGYATSRQFLRSSSNRRRDRRRILFTRSESVEIAPVWPFEKIARRIFETKFPRHFETQYSRAVARARARCRNTSSRR